MGPEMQSGFARWSAESKSWTLGTLDEFAQRMALVPFKFIHTVSLKRTCIVTGIRDCDANSFGRLILSLCHKYCTGLSSEHLGLFVCFKVGSKRILTLCLVYYHLFFQL